MVKAKKFIIKYLPRRLKAAIIKSFSKENEVFFSFSQDGEDMILKSMLLDDSKTYLDNCHGFYVDVGAFHPTKYSNTHYFYLIGWNGINIEPRPKSIDKFMKLRPRDINIQAAISDITGHIEYSIFDNPAYNMCSNGNLKENEDLRNCILINKIQVESKTLEQIFDCYLPQNQNIDFINIDTEGHEYKVLRSNNWNKYRPKYVLVEYIQQDLLIIMHCDIYNFLVIRDYYLCAKTKRTLIFKSLT